MLVRSRGSNVYFWMPLQCLERIRTSAEIDTFAFDPWRVTAATGADMSSYATLVLTFFVLKLETSCPSRLRTNLSLCCLIVTGSLAFAIRRIASRFSFATLALRNLPLGYSRRSRSVPNLASRGRLFCQKFHRGCKIVEFTREHFDV